MTGGLSLGGRGNIVASIGFTKCETVFQSARAYSAFALSSADLVSPVAVRQPRQGFVDLDMGIRPASHIVAIAGGVGLMLLGELV